MILDTNAISALADGNRNLEKVISHIDKFYLPVIVLGEYRFGLQTSIRRKEREN